MTINRDKAQEHFDAIDALNKQVSDSFLQPAQVQQINARLEFLLARAQVHAILALTDPKDEVR